MNTFYITVSLIAAVGLFVALDLFAMLKLKGIRHTLNDTLTTLDAQTKELEALRHARAHPLLGHDQKRSMVVEVMPSGKDIRHGARPPLRLR